MSRSPRIPALALLAMIQWMHLAASRVRSFSRAPSHGRRATWALIFPLALGVLAPGCASHSSNLSAVRESLIAGDFEEAFSRFEEKKGKDDDLLSLLERGYMLHVQRQWGESNEHFDLAELRAEDLYTESLSRQAAALLTSDLALPYRARPYELQMVPYYRALNYLELGRYDDALVEARKANFELSRLGLIEEEEKDGYRHNPFLHYFTGLLYEAAGERNDAIVSFRDAARAYRGAIDETGLAPPRWLSEDYYAAARSIGLYEEARKIADTDSGVAERVREHDSNNLVVFFESGFVPYRESVDITLPVFDTKDGDPWEIASLYVDEYGPAIYTYRHGSLSLDHVLRFSFPILQDFPSAVAYCELVLPGGEVVRAEPALDLAARARQDFESRIPKMLLKTVARAVAKELARRTAKKEDEVLGWVVNAINVATEHADTRSWIFLPGRIDMAKVELPPGPQSVSARFYDRAGVLVDEWRVDLEMVPGETQFVGLRTFR